MEVICVNCETPPSKIGESFERMRLHKSGAGCIPRGARHVAPALSSEATIRAFRLCLCQRTPRGHFTRRDSVANFNFPNSPGAYVICPPIHVAPLAAGVLRPREVERRSRKGKGGSGYERFFSDFFFPSALFFPDNTLMVDGFLFGGFFCKRRSRRIFYSPVICPFLARMK